MSRRNDTSDVDLVDECEMSVSSLPQESLHASMVEERSCRSQMSDITSGSFEDNSSRLMSPSNPGDENERHNDNHNDDNDEPPRRPSAASIMGLRSSEETEGLSSQQQQGSPTRIGPTPSSPHAFENKAARLRRQMDEVQRRHEQRNNSHNRNHKPISPRNAATPVEHATSTSTSAWSLEPRTSATVDPSRQITNEGERQGEFEDELDQSRYKGQVVLASSIRRQSRMSHTTASSASSSAATNNQNDVEIGRMNDAPFEDELYPTDAEHARAEAAANRAAVAGGLIYAFQEYQHHHQDHHHNQNSHHRSDPKEQIMVGEESVVAAPSPPSSQQTASQPSSDPQSNPAWFSSSGSQEESHPNADISDSQNQSQIIGSNYDHTASADSKYECYAIRVDQAQEDRAVEIALFSTARPHMRAFHFAWISFFMAFFNWFAITPLLSEVQTSLHLSTREIWVSSIFGVAGSAVTRIAMGPICDKYGARLAMSGTLFLSAIPVMLTGLVNTGTGLWILRLFIGIAGSAFVTSQSWTSSMFTREVSGTANSLVAGWGNLGGGVTQIVMGSVLFPLFELIFGNEDTAWRTVCIIPGIVTLVTSYAIFKYSDDSPKGNYRKRSSKGLRANVSGKASLKTAAANINTWILALQYASCFGVEITMINAVALYFKEEFAQSTVSAAALASIFGWMNLFARGFGGFVSDMANAKRGMRGRLIWQTVALSLQGVMLLIFAKSLTLGGAVINMIVCSIFVQSTEGSTYGIVPYVDPRVTGSIAGIVGAGGNIGGVCFGLLFTHFSYRQSFAIMGYINMGTIICIAFINIKGHSSLFCGKDILEVHSQRLQHNEQQRNVANVSASYDNESIIRSNSAFGSSLLDDVDRVDKVTSSSGSSVNNVELSPTNAPPPPSDLSKETTNLQCTEV